MYTITVVRCVKTQQAVGGDETPEVREVLLPQSFVAQVWSKDPSACRMLARDQAKHHGLEVKTVNTWSRLTSHGHDMSAVAYAV